MGNNSKSRQWLEKVLISVEILRTFPHTEARVSDRAQKTWLLDCSIVNEGLFFSLGTIEAFQESRAVGFFLSGSLQGAQDKKNEKITLGKLKHLSDPPQKLPKKIYPVTL